MKQHGHLELLLRSNSQADFDHSIEYYYELAWSTNTGGSPSAGRVPFGFIAAIWVVNKNGYH